jgi:rod shape determining protein RodA
MVRLGKLDRPLLYASAALFLYGILILYSAGQTDVPSQVTNVWQRQLMWLGAGIVVAGIAMRISPRVLEWVAPAAYAVGLVLLIVTMFFGSGGGTAASTKSWLTIGGMRIGQPAELAKLTTVLMLARYLGGQRAAPATLRDLVVPCLIAAVPAVLVLRQPDLGSALVFGGILFAMLFWAGAPVRLLIMLASPIFSLVLAYSDVAWAVWLGLVVLMLVLWRPFVWEGLAVLGANLATGIIARPLWESLKTYQQNRLVSFLNPEADPRATGWHIIQSKIAIGSGGLFGKGFTDGSQKRLNFLPAQHTDFIFSVVGEELGFFGVIVALALFAVLLAVLVRIARRCPDPFGSLLAFGILGILFSHIFENVGMTANVMPITGIPLPFFSYGGSFMLTTCLSLGLCFRLAREGTELGYREL